MFNISLMLIDDINFKLTLGQNLKRKTGNRVFDDVSKMKKESSSEPGKMYNGLHLKFYQGLHYSCRNLT